MHRALVVVVLLVAVESPAQPIREVAAPAAPGAAESFLSTDRDGDVLFSWLEPATAPGRFALRFARHHGDTWSAATTIFESSDFFVNWADFPSITSDRNGALIVHWLQKSGTSTYAYDVRYSLSRDRGAHWSSPMLLNRDGKLVEHGFVSIVAQPTSGFAAVWLDGREMSEGKEEGDMTIRYADVGADGRISHGFVLDKRTCECCTTAAALTSDGVVAAFRDRSDKEIRDIAIARVVRGRAELPFIVSDDGWQIQGCPVNGPQIDARGKNVALAWFTGAKDQSRVNVAFSRDSGKSFAAPIRVDDGSPMGRVDILLLPSGDALVTWMEGLGNAAQVSARRVSASGRLGRVVKLADSSAARSSGFPRATLVGSQVWFTWTEPASPKRVHIAVADVGAF